MACTTYCDYMQYTKDKDINDLLDLIRPYFKNSEQIFVDENIKHVYSFFSKNKKLPMYHIHWLVAYHEYQIITLSGSDKDHILSYLYGLLNGLSTFAIPSKRVCLKEFK